MLVKGGNVFYRGRKPILIKESKHFAREANELPPLQNISFPIFIGFLPLPVSRFLKGDNQKLR